MADLLRISIQGALPGGEKWSVNPIYRFTAPIAVSADECAAVAAAIHGIAVPGGLTALNPSTVSMVGTRVEARDINGALENVAEVARSSPVLGTSAVNHPMQTSIVLSLRSTDSTARGKGRLYWPGIGIAMVTATLRFNATVVGDYLTNMNAYLASIRTAVRSVGGMTTASLAVWSRTTPKTEPVVSLRAGDVPDVQRRRRDKLVETYVSAAVAP